MISWRPKSKCKETEAGPRGFKSIFPAFAIFSRRLSIFFSTRLSTTLLVRRACLKWMTKHMSPMACLCQRPQCANRRNITASGRALLSCRLIRGKKIQLVPGCLTCTRNTFYFGRHSWEPYNFGYPAKALQLFHCIAYHKCPYIY